MAAQYHRVPGAAELIELYVVGGYHPVHLGDTYKEQYRIVRKLGNGKYATVWLAKDELLGEHVALKIVRASDPNVWEEVNALKKLSFSPHPLATAQLPVPRLWDSFEITGPNGVHSVLVLELFGSSLGKFIKGMKSRADTNAAFRNIAVLREFSRQIVQAVYYIHSKEIVHRDIHPGNILFALKNPGQLMNEPDWYENDMTARQCRRVYPISRVDGGPIDAHSPKYLVQPQPLESDIIDSPLLSTSRLVLSDFGAATTFEKADDGGYAYPKAFVPPEILIGLPVTEKSDIWALGCTIFHLVTLFDVFWVDHDNPQDDKHLQSMIEVLGPMPESMRNAWKGRRSIVDEDGNLLEELTHDSYSEPLDVQITEIMPAGVTCDESSAFESFMWTIFQWDPEDRPSAEELLQHRWVTGQSAVAKAA